MSSKKILIVDDSETVRKALSLKLTGQGYTVLEAEDGSGAVRTAREERPDLILLDMSFPPDVAHGGGVPWDGFLIVNWMQRMEETKGIPFIVITSSEPQVMKQKVMASQPVSFFQKPFDTEELLRVVRKTLGEPEVEVAPAAKAD